MLGRGVDIHLSRHSLMALGALALVSWVFYQFPEIDLWAAKALYLENGKFLLSNSELSRFFHKQVDMTLKYLFIGGLVIYLLARVSPFRLPEAICQKLNFVFITSFTAVLIVINGILKEFWGRARPGQLAEYGGKADFSAAWAVSDQCQSNCAFVSGHAGIAACAALLAVFLPQKYRTPYLIFAVIFYAVASFMRMARGAHFLSDVTIAGMIVLCVAMLVKDILKLRI